MKQLQEEKKPNVGGGIEIEQIVSVSPEVRKLSSETVIDKYEPVREKKRS